jgi:hypothetical protein
MAKSVSQEFGGLLGDLTKQRSQFKMGRMVTSGQRAYAAEHALGASTVGAAMLITLDKTDFAHMAERMEEYKHIPWRKGDRAFANVANYMTGDYGPITRYFREEKGPLGDWPSLSTEEEMWRIMQGYEPEPILFMSGALYKAVHDPLQMVEVSKTGNYARMILSGEKITAVNERGESVKDEFYTQLLGTLNGWGRGIEIPARPFLPVKPSDLTNSEKGNIRREIMAGITEGTMLDKDAGGRR